MSRYEEVAHWRCVRVVLSADAALRVQVLLSCSHVFHKHCLESFERYGVPVASGMHTHGLFSCSAVWLQVCTNQSAHVPAVSEGQL